MPSWKVFKGSKDGRIVESKTEKQDVQGDQVLIKVTASGLCGTDLHYKNADMVLGHEGVGVVEAIGPEVKKLKRGDRVGWGYEHDSCGLCEYCISGREIYCQDRKWYGNADLDQGSFAQKAIWREAFLFKIPDDLTDEEAAPLMCAGATVWNALRMDADAPTATVGIIGIGGLGHLAIQFASKMGMNVVALSGSENKRGEAMKLGAHRFYSTNGKKELDIGEQKLDTLLITTSFQPDLDLYLPLLKPEATIFPLTVAEGNFQIPYLPMVLNGYRVQGTVVASRGAHSNMIQFAARHQVKPVIMKFPMTKDGIEDAIRMLEEGKIRYRAVLVPQ